METIDTSSAASEIQEVVNALTSMPSDTRWNYLWHKFLDFAPRLLTALIILAAGILLVRWICSFSRKMLKRSKLDPTLHNFIVSIICAVLYIVLGIIVVTVLAPPAAGSLIALFGVFGLAVSLAVKDSLANLAGGMSVLFTKPFALGDYVRINGNEGTIQEIRLNYTILKTFDNKVVHIPNGDVAKAEIVNFTYEPTRRLDLVFSIGYGDDFEKAKRIIRGALGDNPLRTGIPSRSSACPSTATPRSRSPAAYGWTHPTTGRSTLTCSRRSSAGLTRKASRSPTTRWTFICTANDKTPRGLAARRFCQLPKPFPYEEAVTPL